MSDWERYLKGHLQMWLGAVLSGLETQTDEKTRLAMLETCGRACARRSSVYRNVKAIRDERKKVDELLSKLNEETSGQVGWLRDGEVVRITYKRCFCPLRRSELVRAPSFCNCSTGWLEEIFETASGKPVKVELEQAIGKGDPACKFTIRPWARFRSPTR